MCCLFYIVIHASSRRTRESLQQMNTFTMAYEFFAMFQIGIFNIINKTIRFNIFIIVEHQKIEELRAHIDSSLCMFCECN